MCGLSGILYFDRSRPLDRSVVRSMADAIAHRGPDAEGFWFGPGIGLAHRRLSIIDLAEGAQPMSDADQAVHVVFNGEIYNYRELRKTLLGRGHPLRTHSDTEVLLYLYRDHGADMVQHLRGMFAFAIWDSRQEQLLLARDRIGQKPLYYHADDEKVVFGSEIKSILAYPGLDRSLDPDAVDAYLTFGFIPGSLSIYRSIRKLPPAHVLSFSRSRPGVGQPRRYWRLEAETDHSRTAEQWQQVVREKLAETVRCHRIADVPVGTFLSGGVDSGAMVAEMASQSEEPLKTFSIGFQEEAFSELPYARMVAQRYRTEQVEEVVTPDIAADFQKLIYHYDEPFADPSALPTMVVARVASEHVKVVISGDGGDEAFGGYGRYFHDLREAKIRRRLPAWSRRRLLSPLARVWPRADWLPKGLRLKSGLTNLSRDNDRAYANTMSITDQAQRQRLFPASGINGDSAERFVTDAYPAGEDDLRSMTGCDIALVLPDDFLVKVDRASMAVGLEVRPPMVDHEFLEMAASIPSEFKIREGQSKWIFKQAVRDRLPTEILNRKKQGFEIPVDAWMRGPLREPLAETLDVNGPLAGLLDTQELARLLESHRRGTGRHGQLLWALMVLGEWVSGE